MRLNKRRMRNRVQWVRDLVSDEYLQGREGALKGLHLEPGDDDTTFCCLGVAGDRICPKSRAMKIDTYKFKASPFLPRFTAWWELGLYKLDQHRAAEWNDSYAYSFNRIADLVAWATDHGLSFNEITVGRVPYNYGNLWLKGIDGDDSTV